MMGRFFTWMVLPVSLIPVTQQRDSNSLHRYYEEAEKALAENRLDAAAEAYRKSAEVSPNVAEIHAKLGLVYYQQGKFADAVPEFRQALKLKPGLPNAGVLLAICLSEIGRHAEAAPALEKAFRNPPNPGVRRLIGLELQRSYAALRRYDAAAEVALELSRLYPNDPEVLYHAGRVSGDFSYLTMHRLAEVAPDSVWTHQARGEAQEALGHYELAIAEYRKVLAADPFRPSIHLRIGRAILSSQQDSDSHQEALKEFEWELQWDATNADAAYEIGEIHRKAGRLEKARGFFQTAVKHYPDFEEARIGLARVLIGLQEPAQALPHLREAIRLNPQNEISHYQISLAYKSLGDIAAQRRELEEFRRLRDQKRSQDQQSADVSSGLLEATKQKLDLATAPE